MTVSPKPSLIKIFIPIVVILGVIISTLALMKNSNTETRQNHQEINIGSVLKDLEFTTLAGKQTSLSGLRKKVVLVNFWASWCEACMIEMPSIQETWKEFHDHGFEVVGINVDDNPDQMVPTIIKDLGLEFEIYRDPHGLLSDLFDVHAIPYTVILEGSGKILWIETGERDWNSQEMKDKINSWLK